jgi:hypothetical protein
MALPTCPSCKQSVIDDEATECPFCGASMSGKPSSKATAPAPAKPKPQQKKAAPAESSDDENPFDSPAPMMNKGIQLLSKPAKGKLHKVVCPMCETIGFTSKKAAGRDARCANKECLVPIFTVPPLEPDEEASRVEEPKKESTPMPMAVKIAFAAVFGGAGLWALATFVLFPEKPIDDAPVVLPPGVTVDGNTNNTNTGPDKVDPKDKGPNVVGPVIPVGPTIAELREKALAAMIDLSQKTESEGNDNKPLCRRLAAEAYAVVGNTDEVSAQLKQLGELANGPRLKYFEILPMIESAWPSVAAGNLPAAGIVVDQIKELMPLVPSNRSMALEIVNEFSVLLAAMDRSTEAVALIKQRSNDGLLGQFMESFSRCQFTKTYDLNQAVELRPVGSWTAPQWTAVTVGLTARGYSDKALAWARSAPSPRIVNECISAWAEATVLVSRNATVLPAINKEINAIAEPSRSWLKARTALTLAAIGLVDDAKAIAAQAAIKVDPAQSPAEFSLPSMMELYNYKAANVESGRIRTLAAAELAHVNLLLGDRVTAWNAIAAALANARSISASKVMVGQLFADMARQGEAGLSQKFKQTLNLLTIEAGRTAYLKYRANCTTLSTLADVRFELQQDVLKAGIDWDFIGEVWKEIKDRATDRGTKRESWFETGLPSILHSEFRGVNDQPTMTEIDRLVTSKKLKDNAVNRATFDVVASKNMADGKPIDAVNVLNRFKAGDDDDVHWLREIMIRQASKLAVDGDIDGAIKYATAINDNEKQLRGIALELIATRATLNDKSDTLFKEATSVQRYPPDGVSILRGFIEGARGK